MRSGWPTKTIAEMCLIRPPKAEARAKLSPTSTVTFMGMEDLGIDVKVANSPHTRTLNKVAGSYTYFANNDVLLAKITPCFQNGKLGIARDLKNGVGFGSSEFIVLRPERGLDPEYLYYFLSRDDFRREGVLRMGGSVGQQRVPLEYVQEQRIPLPPLSEQQRIVGILDEAFAAIATAKANAEKNLANSRALFESHLQAVFTQRGEGWVSHHKSLADMCDLIVDCEHKTAPTQDDGIPSIRTPNIGKGKLLLDGVYRVSPQTYREWTRRAVPMAGDLILAREAPAGNVAVVPENLPLCLGQRTVLIRPRREVFDPTFLALHLLQPAMQQKLLAHSRGATVQHVNMKDIRALDVGALPSLSVQRTIVARVEGVSAENEKLIDLYERKLAALDALKKSLLHQAFTGQLTAKRPDAAVAST